jgi:hypothetical protein
MGKVSITLVNRLYDCVVRTRLRPAAMPSVFNKFLRELPQIQHEPLLALGFFEP